MTAAFIYITLFPRSHPYTADEFMLASGENGTEY